MFVDFYVFVVKSSLYHIVYFFTCAEGGSKKRKGGKTVKKNKLGPVSIDHNNLASSYYGTIVAGLSLISDLPQALGLYFVLDFNNCLKHASYKFKLIVSKCK